MKCESCHLESEREEVFRLVNRFLKPHARLCPACFQKVDERNSTYFIWSSIILGIVSLPLTFFGPTHMVGYLLLNFSALQSFAVLATIAHELGHIFAACLTGFRAFGIAIGKGRLIYDLSFAGMRCRVHEIPYGGRAYSAPRTARLYKLRRTLVILGGPLANIAGLCIGTALLPLDDYFGSTPLYGFAPALLFTLANAALLPFSLWPHEFKTASGKLSNDAHLLWRTWRADRATVKEAPSSWYFYEAVECQRKKDFDEAQRWINEGLRIFPKNLSLRNADAGNLYLQKRYLEASRSYALLVGRNKDHKDWETLLLNNIAYNILLTGKPELLPRADACSRLALQRAPWLVYCKGTRGSVLIELGRYEEGLKLLHAAMKSHPGKSEQALNARYIGIAEARRGNLNERHNYFAIARRLDPGCVLLNRESDEENRCGVA